MVFWCQWQPTHFGGQLFSLCLFIVLAVPFSDMCSTEHHVHNQGSCYHHSYPSFLTHLFFPIILLAGLHMFRTNRTTEMQYICLGILCRQQPQQCTRKYKSTPFGEKNMCLVIRFLIIFNSWWRYFNLIP
jgi:hypothetical protein